MAKRYYQTKKDRMNESRGMKKYEARKRKDRKDESRGMKIYKERDKYSGREGRDRMEYDGSGMIREDRSAIANLPQNVIMREYPKPYGFTPSRISDTIVGIDIQMDEDASMTKRDMYPEKY